MSLIDRLTPQTAEESKEIAIAEIAGAIYFNAKGDWTVAKIKSVLGLDSTDNAQLGEIAAKIATLSASKQLVFAMDVYFAGIFWERDKITLSEFKNLIGLT